MDVDRRDPFGVHEEPFDELLFQEVIDLDRVLRSDDEYGLRWMEAHGLNGTFQFLEWILRAALGDMMNHDGLGLRLIGSRTENGR